MKVVSVCVCVCVCVGRGKGRGGDVNAVWLGIVSIVRRR